MLNHEGWSLLMIIVVLVAQLLLALKGMGHARTVGQRMADLRGEMDTAVGTGLRCVCPMLLAVVPSAVYGGAARAGLIVCAAAGFWFMLCVVVPRLKQRHPQAVTPGDCVTEDRWARVGFAAASVVAGLIFAAGAVSMLARIFAYVFSLHYMIALGASAALSLVMAVLCGLESRGRMDRLQGVLVTLLMVGLPVCALAAVGGQDAKSVLGAALLYEGTAANLGRDIGLDVLTGVCAAGFLFPVQRMLAAKKADNMKRSGMVAVVWTGMLMLLAGAAGWLGNLVDAQLETLTAAETVLMQIAEQAALPSPVSAVLNAVMVVTLLMYAQDALRCIGAWVAWDAVQPLMRQEREKPLVIAMDLAVAAAGVIVFVLARNANTPLAWFVHEGMLFGAVAGATLVLQAFDVKTKPMGLWIGLGAGVLVALVSVLLPINKSWIMVCAVPVLLATVLPQVILREKKMENKLPETAEEGE